MILKPNHPSLGIPSESWDYTDAEGQPLASIYRFNKPDGRGKEYRPFSLQPDGSWQWKGTAQPRPLYNLKGLADNPTLPVIVVEGEKTADTLQSVVSDYVVTTAMHGAQSSKKTDWSPLENRNVIIWPDADQAGLKYAFAIEEMLHGNADDLSIIPILFGDTIPAHLRNDDNLYSLISGWDAADAVDDGYDPLRIQGYIDRALTFDTLRNEIPATSPIYNTYVRNVERPAHDPVTEMNGTPTPLNNNVTPLREFPTVNPVRHSGNSAPDSDSWPEPDMSILNPELNRPRFPVEAFGPFWSKWISDTAEAVSAPPDYIGGTLLAGASSLIGNARWVSPWEGWEEPPVLWIGLIGSPSASNSPAMSPLLKMITEIERDLEPEYDDALRRYETDKLSAKLSYERWESEAKDATKLNTPIPEKPASADTPLMPPRPRLMVSDTTPEAMENLLAAQPKGFLLYRDELAGLLGNFDRYGGKGGDRAFWLEAFGGRSYATERVKHDGKPMRIPRLAVAILGGIQPDRLNSMLMKGDDDGLTARFLWLWPDRVPPERPTTFPARDRALQALRGMAALKAPGSDGDDTAPKVVMLSPDAADQFQNWRKPHASNEPEGSLASWWGKCPGFILRIAIALEHLWWSAEAGPSDPDSISLTAIDAAIGLVESYFKPMAKITYGLNGVSTGSALAAGLCAEIIKRHPAIINAREVYMSWGINCLSRAEETVATLRNLEEAGWVRSMRCKATKQNGRPRQDFDVNPKLYQNLRTYKSQF